MRTYDTVINGPALLFLIILAETVWVDRSRRMGLPSAKGTTPLGRDNTWRGLIVPRLKTIQLDWATFQIMRRTHASLSRQAGIDPKLVADQLGHGLGVNLEVYTVAALDRKPRAYGTGKWRERSFPLSVLQRSYSTESNGSRRRSNA